VKGLQVFENPRFGQVRFIVVDGKEYAVGIDLAKMLDYAEPHKAISAHCRGGISYPVTDSLGRAQDTKLIPEGDIFRLIVKAAEQSRNPKIREKALEIERWIFDDVLPQIRKTGTYLPQLTNLSPELQMFNTLYQALVKQELKQKHLEEQVQIAQHRINTLDGIAIQGSKRQQLNQMVKKYAFDNGFTFSRAWKDFISAFNNAYRVNLTARKTNANVRSTPEYLEKAGLMDDALRVADKMLNIPRGA
jgi:prophage antirepressor-like protein